MASERSATYTASDPESDAVTWSLAGTDAHRFTISTSGELSFKASKDYEKPNDGNKDNIYEVTVRASDGNLTCPRSTCSSPSQTLMNLKLMQMLRPPSPT